MMRDNELLLFCIKQNHTLIDYTKTKAQETVEFKMNNQLQPFTFSQQTNLVEEGKWLLGVTSVEATNSVFNILDENNSFSITIPGHWNSKLAETTIDELNRLLELGSQKNIELNVEQVRKTGINFLNDYSFPVLLVLKKILE